MKICDEEISLKYKVDGGLKSGSTSTFECLSQLVCQKVRVSQWLRLALLC